MGIAAYGKFLSHKLALTSRNCVIPVACVRTWEMWVVKHNCVSEL